MGWWGLEPSPSSAHTPSTQRVPQAQAVSRRMKADLGVHRKDRGSLGEVRGAQGSEELCQPPVEFASYPPLVGLAGPLLSPAAGWVQGSHQLIAG